MTMSIDTLLRMPIRKALRFLRRQQTLVLHGQEYLAQATGYVPDGQNEGRALSAWLDVVDAYAAGAQLVHVIAERYGGSRRRFWRDWELVKNEYGALCTQRSPARS